MKRFLSLTIISCCLFFACKKDGFITSADARLIAAGGLDTLRFDTVFTSLGSITKSFTIVNDNSQKLRISQVRLGGGGTSPFKINVDGLAGTTFSNLELAPNDSLYVFVRLTIDPNNENQPFVVNDSIEIDYNGNTSKVFLQAYGQNAYFLRNAVIDQNTTWTNTRPYVLLNPLVVDAGATLTIEKGTRIYSNATAGLIVNGNIRAMGGSAEGEQIIFRGDRLDEEYKDLPGGWAGIVFNPTSTNNLLEYTQILNAYQAITALNGARLTMNQSVVHNAYDIGVQAINASINATNCLISQCGNDGIIGVGGSNMLLVAGDYTFNHCTMVTYANYFQNHKQPVLYLSNTDGTNSVALNARFNNCIIYGEGGLAGDEIVVKKGSAALTAIFDHVLYKVKTDPGDAVFNASLKNIAPQFDTINTNRQEYSFRLRDSSPAKDAAGNSPVPIDLEGKPRPVGLAADLGCYEKQD